MGRPKRANAGGSDLPIRVLSRRLVNASDASIKPHVTTVHNMDIIPNSVQGLVTCVYPKPSAGSFADVVAAFETHLPSFLNYFYPMAGRIVFNPSSGLPELHCLNQGTELIIGEVGVALASFDWGLSEESLKKIYLPYAEELPLSVQVLSFTCGGFAVVWGSNNLIGDGNVGVMLVRVWSELVRTGALSEDPPNHDRTLLCGPRDPPSYGAEVAGMFTPWSHESEVNALTAEDSSIERLYYVEERDLATPRGGDRHGRRRGDVAGAGPVGVPVEGAVGSGGRVDPAHRGREAVPAAVVGGRAAAGVVARAAGRAAQLRRERDVVRGGGGGRRHGAPPATGGGGGDGAGGHHGQGLRRAVPGADGLGGGAEAAPRGQVHRGVQHRAGEPDGVDDDVVVVPDGHGLRVRPGRARAARGLQLREDVLGPDVHRRASRGQRVVDPQRRRVAAPRGGARGRRGAHLQAAHGRVSGPLTRQLPPAGRRGQAALVDRYDRCYVRLGPAAASQSGDGSPTPAISLAFDDRVSIIIYSVCTVS